MTGVALAYSEYPGTLVVVWDAAEPLWKHALLEQLTPWKQIPPWKQPPSVEALRIARIIIERHR